MSLAVICTGIHHISDAVFLSSAEALANMVTEDDLAVGRMVGLFFLIFSHGLSFLSLIAKLIPKFYYENNEINLSN